MKQKKKKNQAYNFVPCVICMSQPMLRRTHFLGSVMFISTRNIQRSVKLLKSYNKYRSVQIYDRISAKPNLSCRKNDDLNASPYILGVVQTRNWPANMIEPLAAGPMVRRCQNSEHHPTRKIPSFT